MKRYSIKKNREKIILLMVALLWVAIISGLTWWNIVQLKGANLRTNLATARALFDLVVTTREWNSQLGGVYVPVSEEIQPDPYLNVPDRDILSTDGVQLTKIDHAYMTRLIAEMAKENNNVTYHLTSMNPIRPENAPDGWEKLAFSSFDNGNTERFVWDEQSQMIRYMAPLYVEESCLACHENQGLQVGDMYGGISVSFPSQPAVGIPTLLGYLGIGVAGLAGILVFGTRLIRAFATLEKQSDIDRVTQIYNRSYFDAYLHREFLRARRIRSPFSVLICDIDDFKAYNDKYGHQAGDACLQKVAQALQEVLHRPGDLVARYRDEEFRIMLPDTGPEGASKVAEWLRARIEALKISHRSSKASEYVTISLGVATYDGENISQKELLKIANQALYLAKSKGGNLISTRSVL